MRLPFKVPLGGCYHGRDVLSLSSTNQKSLIKVLSGSVASGTVNKLVPTFGVASGSVLAVFGIPGVWLFVFIIM